MVIDDDPDHQQVLGSLLRGQGYTVYNLVGCEDLDHLKDAVLDFQPDLIFMDHAMPKICGTDATRMLRADPITKNIPVIYFTADDDIEALAEQAGADAFLRKPFRQDEMTRLLDIYG
jgi:two-component system cell cycle response regulator DivK